jgi:hypothetical protein
MSLRGALNAFTLSPPFAVDLPKMPATVESAIRLGRILGDSGGPRLAAEDLDDFGLRIASELEDGYALDNRDLLRAPWCIWGSDYPLSRRPGLVERLLARIAQAGRRPVYRALAGAWLHSFRPDGASIPLVAGFLKERVNELGHPWKEAHAALDIFDATDGPDRIVDAAFQCNGAPDDILSKIGFTDRLSALGYREHIYRLGLERRQKEANGDPLKHLDMIRRWSLAQGKVRFEPLKAAAVRAALEPFGDETPAECARDALLDFAIQLLRDPRPRPEGWRDCPEAETIARRWLTEQSLRLFFAVLDHRGRKERWAHRRAFWNALYRKGHIDEAWVVLESVSALEAQRLFGQSAGFGRFEGFQPGHCVLMLNVRGLRIAEWSHNQPCSIWDEEDDALWPRLYQGAYSPSELRKQHKGDDTPANMASQGVFWHTGAGRYLWQRRIADFLQKRRGLILLPQDYEVGR